MYKRNFLICGFFLVFISWYHDSQVSAKPTNEFPKNVFPAFGEHYEEIQERMLEEKLLQEASDEAWEEIDEDKFDDLPTLNFTQKLRKKLFEHYGFTQFLSDDGSASKEEHVIESYGSDGNLRGQCVFPFIHNGTSHPTCSFVDGLEDIPVCATTDNFDRDNKGGICQAVNVRLRSEGCGRFENQSSEEYECGWSFILVNNRDVSKHGRGHNIAVLDIVSGEVEDVRSFDTHDDPSSGTEMKKFLEGLEERKIVLMVVQEDGSVYESIADPVILKIFGEWPYTSNMGSMAAIGYTGPGHNVYWRFFNETSRNSPVEITRDIPLEGFPFVLETTPTPAPDPDVGNSLTIKIESDILYTSMIEVDGVDLTTGSPDIGIHIVLINYYTGLIQFNKNFDTSSLAEVIELRKIFKSLPEGYIVLVAKKDHGLWMKLLNRYLKKLGSEKPPNFGSYAFLGYSGPEIMDWVQTASKPIGEGKATIEAEIQLANIRQLPTAASINPTTGSPEPETIGNPLPAPGSCGWRKIHSYVIGGENARRGEWPWQIGLYVYGMFGCGGSLISDKWVVTAAHCISTDYPIKSYSVKVGDVNRKINEGSERTIKVKRIISHPDYSSDTLDKDIAVIELEEPVQFNKYVQPVCLAEDGEELPINSKCYITGWGKVNYTGGGHTILQKAKLPPISDKDCSVKLANSETGHLYSITDYMLCAGVDKAIQSGCHGDSGGPYVCQMEDGHWVLHGAVSWGSPKCDAIENYTVFSKISALRSWINKQIGAEEDNISVAVK